MSCLNIALAIAAGLAGAAVATLVVGLRADRLGRRTTLLFLALLSSTAGIALAVIPAFPFFRYLPSSRILNGMGTDRSAAFALEQASGERAASLQTRFGRKRAIGSARGYHCQR